MKIVWFIRRLVNLECNGSASAKSHKKPETSEPICKVIKLEDFEKINRKMAAKMTENLSQKNQYLAALTGLLTRLNQLLLPTRI